MNPPGMIMPATKTKLLFLLITLLFRNPLCGQVIGYFEHFSEESGLTQSSILKIIQDKKGFIWLGTYDGLVRFDGDKFKKIQVDPLDSIGVKSRRINNLVEDCNGRIWLESNLRELYCYQPSINKFWSPALLPDFPAKAELDKFWVMKSGKIWLSTLDHQLYCFRDSLGQIVVSRFEMNVQPDNRVSSVYEDELYNTWILGSNGLFMLPNGERENIESIKEMLPSNGIVRFEPLAEVELESEIWFGGRGGHVFRYVKGIKTFVKVDLDLESTVVDMQKLDEQTLLLQTTRKGCFLYNVKTETLYPIVASGDGIVIRDELQILFVNAPSEVWFKDGYRRIWCFDVESKRFRNITVPGENLTEQRNWGTKIIKDNLENLWIQPSRGGIYFYNRAKDQLEILKQESPVSETISSDTYYVSFVDRQNNLWLGNRNYGLVKFALPKNQFDKYKTFDDSLKNANNVRAICELHDGKLLVATKDEARLLVLNKSMELLGYLSPEGELTDFSHSVWPVSVYAIFQDNKKNIWIGTRGEGIFRFKAERGALFRRMAHYTQLPNDEYSLSDDDVYSICTDSLGRIWVGTWGGGLNLVEESGERVKFVSQRNKLRIPKDDSYLWVRCVTAGNDGLLHIGTTDGLLSVDISGRSPDEFGYHDYPNFGNLDILAVTVDSSNKLYWSTYGGRFFCEKQRDSDGFPSVFDDYQPNSTHLVSGIISITEDNQKRLWLGSGRNLVRFNPVNRQFETFPEVKRLLGDVLFAESSVCKLQNGKLLYGFSNGILAMNPANISTQNFVPYLALTGFELMNTSSKAQELPGIGITIDDISQLVLKHNQGFFRIHFVALDYDGKRNIQYRYRLDGLEDNWNLVSPAGIANYTNIPKGEYRFLVSSTNGNGVWVDNERSLPITVRPSVWNTNLAWGLYALVIIGLFVLIQKTILTIFRLRHDVKVQKQVADMKLRFFTDVSHEIRTPLTMISAPIEQMLHNPGTPEPLRKKLSLVEQNTQRLLNLVSQILDLRKMQMRRLAIEPINVDVLLAQIGNQFGELAVKKGIRFEFTGTQSDTVLWGDRECLNKIVLNLVSNAFKYCPAGSKVKLMLEEFSSEIVLSVSDNGPGIDVEKQKKLFVRFSNFNDNPENPSTGIGLSLVKDMADLHGATVSIDSFPGKGTTFKVCFKKGKEHFGGEVDWIQSSEISAAQEEIQNEEFLSDLVDDKLQKNKQPLGLVVEDNAELRSFIKEVLEDEFSVEEAADGEEGFELALKLNPDFIISDIMMPKVDGIELLKKLRGNIATSHMPVILLTSKSDIESKIEGLEYGADDYLTKPFSVSYLKARVENLLAVRSQLRDFYTNGYRQVELTESKEILKLSPQDQSFMEQIVQLVIENLENSEFSVEQLGRELGASKTTFYNKVKSLTGLSPIEYIRDIRLNHAEKLLVNENILVKEVAFQCGFSDVKYFGRCFKTKYKLNPAEYRKIHKRFQ